MHPIAEGFANNGDKLILTYLLKIHDYEFLAYEVNDITSLLEIRVPAKKSSISSFQVTSKISSYAESF